MDGERFHVWVTNSGTIQQIRDLQAGKSQANIRNGRISRGPGLGGHNLPWVWHLDPEAIEVAEFMIPASRHYSYCIVLDRTVGRHPRRYPQGCMPAGVT